MVPRAPRMSPRCASSSTADCCSVLISSLADMVCSLATSGEQNGDLDDADDREADFEERLDATPRVLIRRRGPRGGDRGDSGAVRAPDDSDRGDPEEFGVGHSLSPYAWCCRGSALRIRDYVRLPLAGD